MDKSTLQECSEDVVLEKHEKGKEKLMSDQQAIDAIRKRVSLALAQPENECSFECS